MFNMNNVQLSRENVINEYSKIDYELKTAYILKKTK
uniref:Uncharacterized protein n=1 Tax=Anguilla anguilla TaxID=7936 RepID=A0A0E9R1U0_ANGAN